MKELNNEREVIVFVNLFAHYPEAYNAAVINDILNGYFKQSFEELNINLNNNCHVMINSAPANENEMIIIDILLQDKQVIIKEEIITKWKEYIISFFNNLIKDVVIRFSK